MKILIGLFTFFLSNHCFATEGINFPTEYLSNSTEINHQAEIRYKASFLGAESFAPDMKFHKWVAKGITNRGQVYGVYRDDTEIEKTFVVENGEFTIYEMPYSYCHDAEMIMNEKDQVLVSNGANFFLCSKNAGINGFKFPNPKQDSRKVTYFDDLGEIFCSPIGQDLDKSNYSTSYLYKNGFISENKKDIERIVQSFKGQGFKNIKALTLLEKNKKGECIGTFTIECDKEYFFWDTEDVFLIPTPLFNFICDFHLNDQSVVMLSTSLENTLLWNKQEGFFKEIPDFIGERMNNNGLIFGYTKSPNKRYGSKNNTCAALWREDQLTFLYNALGYKTFEEIEMFKCKDPWTPLFVGMNDQGQIVCNYWHDGKTFPCILEPIKN